MDSMDAARVAMNFEISLKIGSEVYAIWSSRHQYHCIKAKIARINDKSFTVELIEAKQGCEVGEKINIPNFMNPKWATNNRVYTIEI